MRGSNTLEEEVLDTGAAEPDDAEGLAAAVEGPMEDRLAVVARATPAFAAALRGYRRARLGDRRSRCGVDRRTAIGGSGSPPRRGRAGRPRPLRRALAAVVEGIVNGVEDNADHNLAVGQGFDELLGEPAARRSGDIGLGASRAPWR